MCQQPALHERLRALADWPKSTNQPSKKIHDSVTSHQCTQTGLRYHAKWSSLFCSTHRVVSPVSFPKAATDPVNSLLDTSLHAMGAWCTCWVTGSIVCEKDVLILVILFDVMHKAADEANRTTQRTAIVVVSDCQERRHFRWTYYRGFSWDQVHRSACPNENWVLVSVLLSKECIGLSLNAQLPALTSTA